MSAPVPPLPGPVAAELVTALLSDQLTPTGRSLLAAEWLRARAATVALAEAVDDLRAAIGPDIESEPWRAPLEGMAEALERSASAELLALLAAERGQ